MKKLAEKQNELAARRWDVEVQINNFEYQMASKNRKTRNSAKKVLEVLYHEKYLILSAQSRLAAVADARSKIGNFFRH